MMAALKSVFADLGLLLDSFVVENISLPDELQKLLDQRIGMNMVGDMGRYTQFQVAQSMPIAAANEGGGAAGMGVGLGAGMAMAQQMMGAMHPAAPAPSGSGRCRTVRSARRAAPPNSASVAASPSRARRISARSAAARNSRLPPWRPKESRAVSVSGLRGGYAVRPCHGWHEVPVLRTDAGAAGALPKIPWSRATTSTSSWRPALRNCSR
jgi:hypothetical protein